MGALHRKLHEQRGASMLMALFLLLVALMVSAVVIAAASSAATTLHSDKAQEQSSLAVSSAAEYVRDVFADGEMDGTITVYWGSASYSSDNDGAFRDFVSFAIPTLYLNHNARPQRTYKLSLTGDDAVEDVWADFEMSYGMNENKEYSTYILHVTLRNWETTPGEHPCSTTLILYSNLTERPQWGYTYTDVTWDGYNTIQR